MDYKFNDEAVTNVFSKLINVKGVDKYSLSYEACDEIIKLLGIDKLTDIEDVRAIRNSVVKIFANYENVALNIDPKTHNYKDGVTPSKEDYELYDMYHMYMSAITCAIDDKMWKMGDR